MIDKLEYLINMRYYGMIFGMIIGFVVAVITLIIEIKRRTNMNKEKIKIILKGIIAFIIGMLYITIMQKTSGKIDNYSFAVGITTCILIDTIVGFKGE